ncbi:hypothetical protein FK178_09765 [Antarcticibacterium arcticum]|uniref:Uncharacterized protein n=1 Tax=Antarcticibacterium arcticum TaxID=2585771 RepID=A0A5B8YK16_9FLAO|nr:hypothetical protein [Antarcticibacterium arcticum]QED37995.1 hypothetical protein FK178_09765 [Antarcticibacterium arcticum]
MKIITLIAYVLAVLFLFFLLKSLWLVLPQYWWAFGRFKYKFLQNYGKAGIYFYKLRGFKKFTFRKGSLKGATEVTVMAKTEKEAYRKFKTYTNSNRSTRMQQI